MGPMGHEENKNGWNMLVAVTSRIRQSQLFTMCFYTSLGCNHENMGGLLLTYLQYDFLKGVPF